MTRDKRNYKQLKEQGWRVIVIWACKLEKNESREDVLSDLVRTLTRSVGRSVGATEEKQHDPQGIGVREVN